MNSLNQYISEKLKINKDSKIIRNGNKKFYSIYGFELEVLRPFLEESGYYYGSDYDTNISKDDKNLDIYITQDEKMSNRELEEFGWDIVDELLKYNISWETMSADVHANPQAIHITNIKFNN